MNNKIIAFALLSLAVAVLFYAYMQKNKVETKHNSFVPVVDITPKQEIKIEQEQKEILKNIKNQSHSNEVKNIEKDLNIKNVEEDLNIDDLDADIDNLEL